MAEDQFNEISQFLRGRYVAASEAVWRLFHFKIQDHSPTVYRLNIHLPDEQGVVFDQDNDQLNDLLNRNQTTTLTAWFELNKIDPVARELFYYDIPTRFTYNKKEKIWETRKKFNKVVGRIYNVPCKDIERFSLRLLLHNVKGATRFEDLRTFNGVEHNTFQAAAIARGLLENANEAIDTLREAALVSASSEKFRQFFVTYILNCPTDFSRLWTEFKQELSFDILLNERHRFNDSSLDFNENILSFALYRIKELLMADGADLNYFPSLPQLNENRINELFHYFGMSPDTIATDINIQEAEIKYKNNYSLFNREQKSAFDKLVAEISGNFKKILLKKFKAIDRNFKT